MPPFGEALVGQPAPFPLVALFPGRLQGFFFTRLSVASLHSLFPLGGDHGRPVATIVAALSVDRWAEHGLASPTAALCAGLPM